MRSGSLRRSADRAPKVEVLSHRHVAQRIGLPHHAAAGERASGCMTCTVSLRWPILYSVPAGVAVLTPWGLSRVSGLKLNMDCSLKGRTIRKRSCAASARL